MSNFKLLGTQYGGWFVNPDLIPVGSTIISAGVGEDISFDQILIETKKCKVLGIDPTEKAARYIKNNPQNNFVFIQKALSSSKEKIKIYKNKNPEWVSESCFSTHDMVTEEFYKADSITIDELLQKYNNVSLIKMDIEGSEYQVIENITKINVPQICVEFHHFCTNTPKQRTIDCIKKMASIGYSRFLEKPNSPKHLSEITFLHDEVRM